MKYKGSKIALGLFLIILAFVGGIPQIPQTSEEWGSFVFKALLIVFGAYFIYKGSKERDDRIKQPNE